MTSETTRTVPCPAMSTIPSLSSAMVKDLSSGKQLRPLVQDTITTGSVCNCEPAVARRTFCPSTIRGTTTLSFIGYTGPIDERLAAIPYGLRVGRRCRCRCVWCFYTVSAEVCRRQGQDSNLGGQSSGRRRAISAPGLSTSENLCRRSRGSALLIGPERRNQQYIARHAPSLDDCRFSPRHAC